MAHSDVPEVLPEELAALNELARLLEQYQTFLIAGNGFADAARAQAGNVSGTARPALERLHPRGAAGLAQIDAALRRRRPDEDPKTALEDLDPALKDLRAWIATVKWQKRLADAPTGTSFSTIGMAPPSAIQPVGGKAPATAPAPPASRSKAWLGVGVGLLTGLFLGVFGTALPKQAGGFSTIWAWLGPVIAIGSTAILATLLLRTRDVKRTVRTHRIALLICAVLLVATMPVTVESAKELFRMGKSQPAAQAPAPTTIVPADARPAVVDPAPIAPAVGEPASPASATGGASDQPTPPPAAKAPPSPSSPAPAPKSPPPQPSPRSAAKAAQPGPGTSNSQGTLSTECRRLLERVALGEQDNFTASEKALLLKCK